MIRNMRMFSALLFYLAAMPGLVYAEYSGDAHLMRDDHVRLDIDNVTFAEFKRLYDEGYPPASIMLHGIALGMPLDDLVYIAVRSDPGRGQEFYDTAVHLAPSLPGWVCRTGDVDDRYVGYLSPDQLGSQPSIAAVADQWFNNKMVLAPFPDWEKGRAHMNASVAELSRLVDSQKYWYTPGTDDGTMMSMPNRPLFVSLYRDNGEIVVDGDLSQIQRARQQGKETLPVVVVYNQTYQRPLSRYKADVTLSEVAEEFFNNRLEVTPVPEWEVGDYHKMATLDEIRSVVDDFKTSDISDDDVAAAESTIQRNGGVVKAPLLLTLFRSGNGKVWVNSPATLAAAENLGVSEMPVTLFFHDIDRQPCGAESSCLDNLCDAVVDGGGSEDMCRSSTASAAMSSGNGTADADHKNNDGPLG